jgi:hypothetical protein
MIWKDSVLARAVLGLAALATVTLPAATTPAAVAAAAAESNRFLAIRILRKLFDSCPRFRWASKPFSAE